MSAMGDRPTRRVIFYRHLPSPLLSGSCAWSENSWKGPHCPPVNDSLYCWPATPPNTTIFGPCPAWSVGENGSVLRAHRTCGADGTWSHGNWTNYSACIVDLPPEPVYTPQPQLPDDFIRLAEALRDIYLAASIISLVFLLITLFIFCHFRSLQCSRISIHKHLVVSFIFRFILILVMVQPYFTRPGHSYRQIPWLCKTLTSLLQYTLMSNFAWMLVEGIYLHNRLAVCVFRSDAPFKIFYFIGWGVPFLLTCLWAALMEVFYQKPCWQLYSKSPFFCLIFVPILIALVINCAFLVNIIRVLVVKLRTNNTIESRRIRKAIKATIILLPLLGMTNLLFLLQPAEQGPLMVAYRVINAILPSCQGIFVSVLYCFMNAEVQSVIRKKWNRFRVNRAMNTRSRRQGSRTSSFFLSQSEGKALMDTPLQSFVDGHSHSSHSHYSHCSQQGDKEHQFVNNVNSPTELQRVSARPERTRVSWNPNKPLSTTSNSPPATHNPPALTVNKSPSTASSLPALPVNISPPATSNPPALSVNTVAPVTTNTPPTTSNPPALAVNTAEPVTTNTPPTTSNPPALAVNTAEPVTTNTPPTTSNPPALAVNTAEPVTTNTPPTTSNPPALAVNTAEPVTRQ